MSFDPGVGLRPRSNCALVLAQVSTDAAVLYSKVASSAIRLRTKHSSEAMRFRVSLATRSASMLFG